MPAGDAEALRAALEDLAADCELGGGRAREVRLERVHPPLHGGRDNGLSPGVGPRRNPAPGAPVVKRAFDVALAAWASSLSRRCGRFAAAIKLEDGGPCSTGRSASAAAAHDVHGAEVPIDVQDAERDRRCAGDRRTIRA